MMETLTPWRDVVQNLQNDPFNQIISILLYIGVDPSTDPCLDDFTRDYYDALCFFDDETLISSVFASLKMDAVKYLTAFDLSSATETEHRERKPNLTNKTTGFASGNSNVTRNQTQTQTETPYTSETDTHKVTTYESNTLNVASEDEHKKTGTQSISTSYTGQPDNTSTSSSGASTTTETGTDTVNITRMGSPTKTVKDYMDASDAAKTVWKMIKTDLAKKLFFQIWR